MRCLHCHQDGLSPAAEFCPRCGVQLAALLRDLLPAGTLLCGGLYRVEFPLGQGGFGITYLATHTTLEHAVAIKEYYPGDYVRRDGGGRITVLPAHKALFAHGLERFLREGRTLVKLKHPGIVGVQNLFEERGTAYIVMDLVSGRSLREELDAAGGRLPEPQIRGIFQGLVDALAAMHAAGIYHLDIKPENILLDAAGRPILIDFGTAKQGFATGATNTRAFTPQYAPLEVIAGKAVGPQSDIFELGVLLYELLTGALPPPALDRVGGDTLNLTAIKDLWRPLLAAALLLQREQRPADVRAWARGEVKPVGASAVTVAAQSWPLQQPQPAVPQVTPQPWSQPLKPATPTPPLRAQEPKAAAPAVFIPAMKEPIQPMQEKRVAVVKKPSSPDSPAPRHWVSAVLILLLVGIVLTGLWLLHPQTQTQDAQNQQHTQPQGSIPPPPPRSVRGKDSDNTGVSVDTVKPLEPTPEPKMVTVPDCAGMLLSAAVDILKHNNLRCKKKAEETTQFPASSVIRTSPAMGQSVKVNSVVVVTYAIAPKPPPGASGKDTTNDPMAPKPPPTQRLLKDYAGWGVAEAKSDLHGKGCKVSIHSEAGGEPGIVIRTEPPAGSEMSKKMAVTLIVGE